MNPFAELIQARDGNFYGTTDSGGTGCAATCYGFGTVFKMDSSGTVTMLHSFAGTDGQNPAAGLIQGSDGNFYGTTVFGGPGQIAVGTVFKMDSSGTLTTLHSFTGQPLDGANPTATLIQGSDANFYGTTAYGGTANKGTVFKITPSGAVTVLHSFAGQPLDGAVPLAGLIKGSDGNFYGTTSVGGATDGGTVFKMDSSGVVTTLHSFTGSDGKNPQNATLIQGKDGNFYGTTYLGGTADKGTVFKMDSSGALTTLHSFAGSDGANPFAGLIQGRDGNFYGTTLYGSTANYGTVFQMDASGAVTVLHSFEGSEGAYPFAGLLQGSDGNLYGTATRARRQFGVIFRINTGTPTPVQLSTVVSRKTHGGAGTFDINLPLTGNPGIECRRSGANGDHRIVFTFANPVTVNGIPDKARLTSGTGTVSNVIVNGGEVTVDLTGVTNAQKITLTLFNVSDGTNTSDVSVPMGVLVGDVNATGAVDGNDVSAVQGQTRRPVNLSTFRYDVNGTGRIDGNDVSITQSKTRTRLP